MESVKVLIFGTDDLYPNLKNFYEAEVEKGNIEIVGYATLAQGGGIDLSSDPQGKNPTDVSSFQFAIISSRNDFFRRMKILESQGIPRGNILDGTVFQVPNLDFQRFLAEGVAYGKIDTHFFESTLFFIYPRVLVSAAGNSLISFDTKSYIAKNAFIDGSGVVNIGKFSNLSWNITFELSLNGDHNHRLVSSYSLSHLDWFSPQKYYPNLTYSRILIGSDVWVGRGCFFKAAGSSKPLTIGDGAVIASDSVVVDDVPPYAIVGGNPARIIKYRFPEKIIEALLRIKWWNWSLDRIYENFQYFDDIEKFVELNDEDHNEES